MCVCVCIYTVFSFNVCKYIYLSLCLSVSHFIYIYIYIVLFGPVKPVGSNSIRTRKLFKSEHLNFPGKELNVTDNTEEVLLNFFRVFEFFKNA